MRVDFDIIRISLRHRLVSSQETVSAHHQSYSHGRTRDLIDAYLHELKAHQKLGEESSFTGEWSQWSQWSRTK